MNDSYIGGFSLLALVMIFGSYLDRSEEVTVHKMNCAGTHEGGYCNWEQETANPTTYRAYPDQQTVIYWVWNSDVVTRFTSCAVRDGDNWTCQFEKPGDAPKIRYNMNAGMFSTTDFRSPEERLFDTSTKDLSYTVPRWHWWLVRIKEKLRPYNGK